MLILRSILSLWLSRYIICVVILYCIVLLFVALYLRCVIFALYWQWFFGNIMFWIQNLIYISLSDLPDPHNRHSYLPSTTAIFLLTSLQAVCDLLLMGLFGWAVMHHWYGLSCILCCCPKARSQPPLCIRCLNSFFLPWKLFLIVIQTSGDLTSSAQNWLTGPQMNTSVWTCTH